MSDDEVGQRVEVLRRRRGLSREQLAAIAEVSASLIKSVEMGRRALTLRTAQRIGPILGVKDLSEFYGDAVRLSLDGRATHPAIPDVRRALTAWQVTVDGRPESPEYLRGLVDSAWQTWHTSAHQRSEVGRILPGLIDATRRSSRLTDDRMVRRRVLAMEAQAYHLAQAYLAWHGERELVYLTVDRGMAAALDADDPLAIASSVWYAAHLLRAVGRTEEALVQLAEARALVEQHMPDDPDADWPAMLADLWLCSALTRGRSSDQAAYADLEQAERVVRLLPDGYAHPWTRVGRVVADITGVMVAADLGDADEVRRRAAGIDPATIPSTDRRARHLVELARGTNLEGSPEGTLHLLSQAAQVSAETVAYTPAARDLASKLLRTSSASSRQDAEKLAQRVGLEL